MGKRPEFIQLEQGDDAISVRDRITPLRGKNVLLIWPEQGTVLRRKLDLVLIQREAMRRSIRLALVTHDPQVVKHATEMNISTFETVGASERGRWKRGRSKVFTNRDQRPEDEPEPEALEEVASRTRTKAPSRSSRERRYAARLFVLLLLGIVTLGLVYIVLPGATVTLTPASNLVQITVDVVADTNSTAIDVESGIIPATVLRVEVEEVGTTQTTGSQDLGNVPATGSIVVINQTDSPVILPAGTTVSTSAGTPVLFRTTEDARLESGVGNQLEVPIEALGGASGEAGNVDSGMINTVIGPLANVITVRNLAPTTGGESRTVAVVTEEDRERLLAIVRQQIQSRAFTEILPRLSDTQFIIIETVHIAEERSDWTTFSAEVGDVADTLTLTMRAIVEATTVNEQLGRQIAFAQLAQQIPAGHIVRPESVNYERGPAENLDNNRIHFTMTGTGAIVEEINTAQIQDQIAGLSVEEALAFLENEYDLADDAPPVINLTPDWFGQLPMLPMRISIVVQER
ncbi:MAG: hypothetical protein D6737_07615 [Chloroflexi bacterium]|nr:MAG: hypothetical protein D6737_07615 [Chloroflexota bacterium]